MGVPLRVTALVTAMTAASMLALAGCVPRSVDPFAPSPTPPEEIVEVAEQTRELIEYTIDLPAGWNDLTDEYLAEVPNSVMSGFWSMAPDVSTEAPFATMSLHFLSDKVDPATAAEEAAQGWAEDMDAPQYGDSGQLETGDGGIVTWASVTGGSGADERTMHTAYVFYGAYFMYVVTDAPAGDEASSHALLGALETVTMSGPVDFGDRAGAPVAVDGRWVSYCETLEAEAQEGWGYTFTPYYDATRWRCPVGKDYLGHWEVETDGSTFEVEVDRIPNTTLDAHLAALGVSGAVGEPGETINGYPTEVLAKRSFDAPSGSEGVVIDAATTVPGGTRAAYSRSYMFVDTAGGVVSVFVFADDNEVPETAWLEPFIATISTPEAS